MKLDFNMDAFKGVSDTAKDLVSRILVKKRAQRIRMEEVMAHPWT
jgi:hypothetical protein